jgi:hypothetical protein
MWRLWAEYLKAVKRAPIGVVEKARTVSYIVLWTARNRRELRQDLITGRTQQKAGARTLSTRSANSAER